MAIQKIVNTKFTANDKITKRFGIMEKAAARFGRGADKSFRRASKSASKFSGITKGILGAQAITRGLGFIERGVSNVVSGFIEFEKAARGATVRFKDIGPTAANFNQQMKSIRQSARAAGATTEFTAAQAAGALDFLARAGFSSTEAMGSLKSMIDLATASGEEFATVADFSSDLLGAFGLNVDDTAQKISNLNRLNDVLVKSANSANVTIEDMFETMKTAAPIGKTLGIELEEIAALTSVMGNSGIKATQAGTALKNAFLRLSAGGKPIQSMLDKIGVAVDDGSGNMRKFTDILSDVGQQIKGLGNLEQAKVLETLFGKRAIAGASNLIENISQLKDFEKMLKGAGDTSAKTAAIMRESLDAQLKTLISTVTEAGFKILTAFEVDGKRGIEALTEAIRNFDVKPVIEFFKMVSNGIKFIWEWRNALLAIGGGLIVIKTLLGLLTAINVVMALNPIGLIVLGVVALTAGIVALFTWIEDLIAGFDSWHWSLQLALAPLRAILAVVQGIKAVGNFLLGLGGGGTPPTPPPAPNATEAGVRAEQSQFQGRLDIAGAPEGSSVSVDSGSAPGFEIGLLGAI